MARLDEPDPATWWERYGYRLQPRPTAPRLPASEPAPPVTARFGPALPGVAPVPVAGPGSENLHLDPATLVRARGPVPDRGWRRLVHAGSLGRVDPGPG